MRRLIVLGLIVVALGATSANAVAQSPTPSATPVLGSESLCVTIAGQIPAELTVASLGQALADGTVQLITVRDDRCVATGPDATPTPASGLSRHKLTVHFVLKDKSGRPSIAGKGKCHGTGGYSDIAENTQVTVRDGDGTIVAVGSLGTSFRSGPHECNFIGTVENVPDDLTIYQVEVGRRGALSFTYDELEQQAWIVIVSLGD